MPGGRFSKEKGKRGERGHVQYAEAAGVKAERRGHRQVSEDVSDVFTHRTVFRTSAGGLVLPEIRWECKHEGKTPIATLKKALDQAGPKGAPRGVAIKAKGEADYYYFFKGRDFKHADFEIVAANDTGGSAGDLEPANVCGELEDVI